MALCAPMTCPSLRLQHLYFTTAPQKNNTQADVHTMQTPAQESESEKCNEESFTQNLYKPKGDSLRLKNRACTLSVCGGSTIN